MYPRCISQRTKEAVALLRSISRRALRKDRHLQLPVSYYRRWQEIYFGCHGLFQRYAFPNQETLTVARARVESLFSRFRGPLELHFDQGRNFESDILRGVCYLLGIRKTRTTRLHSQPGGMIKRFNKTLEEHLGT